MDRRQFLKGSAGALGAVAVGGSIYGIGYEPHKLLVTEHTVVIPRLPEALHGIRIAQLSDLHFKPFTTIDIINHAVEATNRVSPDLVVLTGDFVTEPLFGPKNAGANAVIELAPVLAQLRAPLGVMAVLGNHDCSTNPGLVTEAIQSHGIQMLRNRNLPIERNGARLWIAGVDDVLFNGNDINRALSGIPRTEATVVLVHEPDFADVTCRYAVDLQLSGHSHGGQVRVPVYGPIYLPPLAREYPRGLRKLGTLSLYTNCGIGTIGVPVRIWCPPELSIFTLVQHPLAIM